MITLTFYLEVLYRQGEEEHKESTTSLLTNGNEGHSSNKLRHVEFCEAEYQKGEMYKDKNVQKSFIFLRVFLSLFVTTKLHVYRKKLRLGKERPGSCNQKFLRIQTDLGDIQLPNN